jgi:hypothetical protein
LVDIPPDYSGIKRELTMNTRDRFYTITLLVLAQIVSPVAISKSAATPESRAAVLFLKISPSNRVNGMGGGGVALPEEIGGHYNPATPAVFGRNAPLAVTSMKKPWLIWLADDLSYSHKSIQLAWNSRFLSNIKSGDYTTRLPSWTAALTLNATKLDLGLQTRTDERGNFQGMFRSFDKSTGVILSLGYHNIVDIGIGIGRKNVVSNLADQGAGIEGNAEATAYDFGLLTTFPLIDIAERFGDLSLDREATLRPIANLSTGIAFKNRGDGIAYIDVSQADPLPTHRSFGWSGKTGLEWRKDYQSLDLITLNYSSETYTPQIAGFRSDSRSEDDMSGYEISLAETITIRRGEFNDYDGELRFKTKGFSIKTDGLFKYILYMYTPVKNPHIQQSQPEDVIYLKDGGVRRGSIIEIIPNETIKLKNHYGDIFVIKLSEIDKIVKGNIEKVTEVSNKPPLKRNWIMQLASSVSISFTRYNRKQSADDFFPDSSSNIDISIRF